MNGAEARARLLSLLRERALLRGDFVLSSGRHSSYYLDARIVTLSAEGSGLVGTVFLDALAGAGVQAAAGLTMGADPIVSAIAVVAGLHGDAIDGLIIRKEPKSHGVGRQIEGPRREGLRVAVVDDMSEAFIFFHFPPAFLHCFFVWVPDTSVPSEFTQ